MRNRKYTLGNALDVLVSAGVLTAADVSQTDFNRELELITYDSRKVVPGTLFVCKGAHFKGEYLLGAIEKGAFCYVSEVPYEGLPEGFSYVLVNNMRRALAVLADLFYERPWQMLKTVGLTGTKGKSTTAFFIKSVIDAYEASLGAKPCGILSSIDNYDGGELVESHLTTPETFELHEHFETMADAGLNYMVMEVSSQALKYDRTYGIRFDVGAFLNIGEDHISGAEHSDYEDYFSSKLKLFSQCKTLVLNRGCDEQERIRREALLSGARLFWFGTDERCDLYGYDVHTGEDGISFKARCKAFDEEFGIALHGLFNVDNALCAIAVCYQLGIPVEYIKAGLATAKVSGRMEIFSSNDGELTVVVDYAHNKMSFESLFSSMKEEFPDSEVRIVFGCPGGKALGRRQELAEISGKYAQRIWLTEEDAGEEDVLAICEEIAGNLQPYNREVEIVPDRGEAIRQAMSGLNGKTLVLITGKGRETRMKRGTAYIDTPSDVDFVEKYMKDIK